ncbi:MAG: SDR family NAD(P)-dependent oxidoreductase [Actinomycetota bacterium]|nr:SDR family NAD(P)-dependent oxidoreductase [Actinomycetota bacterium]
MTAWEPHPRRPDLRGVRVLVTGGTSGLGRAMAHALVQAGAQTIVTGRDPVRSADAARGLGGNAVGLAMDVRDESAVEQAVDEIDARFEGIDMLVNNAGIGMRSVNPRFLTEPQPFWAVTPDGFRDVVATKVTGSFLVARAVVARMIERGGGRGVMISMNTATMSRKGFVPYGPSGVAGCGRLPRREDRRVRVRRLADTQQAVTRA